MSLSNVKNHSYHLEKSNDLNFLVHLLPNLQNSYSVPLTSFIICIVLHSKARGYIFFREFFSLP